MSGRSSEGCRGRDKGEEKGEMFARCVGRSTDVLERKASEGLLKRVLSSWARRSAIANYDMRGSGGEEECRSRFFLFLEEEKGVRTHVCNTNEYTILAKKELVFDHSF